MMSSGPRIELSTVQIVASVLAAVTAAVLTSYLGVGGTVIGAAVASFASTAGFAVYKQFLGRTKDRLNVVTPVIVEHARVWSPTSGHLAAGRRAGNGSGRTGANGSAGAAVDQGEHPTQPMHVWDPGTQAGQQAAAESRQPGLSGQPAQSSQPGQPSLDQTSPDQTSPDQPSPDQTSPDQTSPDQTSPDQTSPGRVHIANGGHGGPGQNGSNGSSRRPRWLMAAATSIAIFVVVIVGITVFELATGKPIAAIVWGHGGSGTTVGNVVTGNQGSGNVAPQPTGTAAPRQSATTPGTATPGPATPRPSSSPSLSTSPAPSTVPSPSTTPSAGGTPSAGQGATPPAGQRATPPAGQGATPSAG
jgi:hypothetical protein